MHVCACAVVGVNKPLTMIPTASPTAIDGLNIGRRYHRLLARGSREDDSIAPTNTVCDANLVTVLREEQRRAIVRGQWERR